MIALAAAIEADSGWKGGAATAAAAMGREVAEETAVGSAPPFVMRARLAEGSIQDASSNSKLKLAC
jgi:hypothetical protein